MSGTGQRRPPPDLAVPIGVDGDSRRQRALAGGVAAAGGVDRSISALATRQDGIVARRQLVALGLSAAAIDHRVRTGKLAVVHRGIYAVGHAALTDRARMRAALMAAGRGAVLSHRTAAHLLRLTSSMPPLVEVTVARKGPRTRGGLVVHTTSNPPETRTVGALPLTAPLRTLVDLARHNDIDRLCSEALVLRLVTEPQLADAGLLSADVAPTRSELERAFRRLMRRAGLPQPLSNTTVEDHEVDFAWPDHRVVVETDGWAAHGHRVAFERDRARDAALAALGHAVLRFTYRQVRDEPVRVAAQLAPVLRWRSPRPRGPAAA